MNGPGGGGARGAHPCKSSEISSLQKQLQTIRAPAPSYIRSGTTLGQTYDPVQFQTLSHIPH